MDLTNGFVLRKPFQARANGAAVSKLIQEIYSIKVAQFVSDNPRVDLEPFGLLPPVLECRVGADTNTLALVQFGGSPTNDANLVYARLSVNNNLVLLPRTILDQLKVSVRDLRDPHMFSFAPEAVAVAFDEDTPAGTEEPLVVVIAGDRGAMTSAVFTLVAE